ncbi:MAG: DUF3810 domain-containing protein [Solobacterium sp.]|nr:DUF3810 domain-containing protein [Solobacterium sp.]
MKKDVRRLLAALFILVSGILEMVLIHRYPDFFFPGYRLFSKKWLSFIAYLVSFTHHSVWDAGALCLVLLLIYFLICCIRKKGGFVHLLSNTLLIISILAFSAFQGWLGNHYAPKLSKEISLEVSRYTKEELYEAAEYYYLKAAEYAGKIERDTDGHALKHNLNETGNTAGASYLSLAEQYPVFKGSSVPVKHFTLIGEYLLYNGITGMFMPITAEASVPANVPTIPLPFTMCHEAAHRLGIASEQEANFCAFLACRISSDPYFLYSGYYEAFGYCYSSLYSADYDKAAQLYHLYDDLEGIRLIQLDRQDTRKAYSKYESPLQDVSDHINDTYLKTFSQESGIRSYGEVTDYLIAWYLAGNEGS